jgi:cytochrome c oxidase subunit 5a
MRPPLAVATSLLRARPIAARIAPAFVRPSSNSHSQETFESFTDRYVNFFQQAQDLFEVQRGLNNCFAHDLVPAPAVVEAALRASRRVNDYATAVRIFEGVREKVENKQQYSAYLEELKVIREELGTCANVIRLRVLANRSVRQVSRLEKNCIHHDFYLLYKYDVRLSLVRRELL